MPIKRRASLVDDELLPSFQRVAIEEMNRKLETTSEMALFVNKGEEIDFITLTDTADSQRRLRKSMSRKAFMENSVNIMNVPSGNISQSEMARYWDSISLRESEFRVMKLLRQVAPVERVTSMQRLPQRSERIILFKLENHSVPIPLKSMGEGIARILQIALTLESGIERDSYRNQPSLFDNPEKQNNYLFIDELENGVHFSALEGLWSFIFSIAEERNIQVFVTSHSWDCIEAFQKIARTYESMGALISLKDKKMRKIANTFSEQELKFISKNDIEVR